MKEMTKEEKEKSWNKALELEKKLKDNGLYNPNDLRALLFSVLITLDDLDSKVLNIDIVIKDFVKAQKEWEKNNKK